MYFLQYALTHLSAAKWCPTWQCTMGLQCWWWCIQTLSCFNRVIETHCHSQPCQHTVPVDFPRDLYISIYPVPRRMKCVDPFLLHLTHIRCVAQPCYGPNHAPSECVAWFSILEAIQALQTFYHSLHLVFVVLHPLGIGVVRRGLAKYGHPWLL